MAQTIDVHTHYLAAALVRALERRTELPRISDGPGGRQIEYGRGNIHPYLPAMGDVELRLREMDEQGIDVAVLSINIPGVDWFPEADGPAVARDVNDELADLVARYPDRFAALATLPLQTPDAAAAELERAMAAGFRGAMIYSNVAGRALDSPELRVVFDVAARLRAPIFIHPTFPLTASTVDAYALIPTLGFMFDTTTAVLRLVLDGLYERHPDFRLVLAHAASLLPQLAGRIDYEAERHGNGRGAISTHPSEHLRRLYTDSVCVWPPALRSTLELLGPEAGDAWIRLPVLGAGANLRHDRSGRIERGAGESHPWRERPTVVRARLAPGGDSRRAASPNPATAPDVRAILLRNTKPPRGSAYRPEPDTSPSGRTRPQMLERLENRPLAVQARDTILQAILQQRFDGGRLPSEDELASMLNVSRTTIRTALHSLEQDGIITRRRALGTTVNKHIAPDLVALQRLAGFDWLLREKGHDVEVDVTWSRDSCTDETRILFGWEGEGECLLTQKLFFADGELAIYVRDLVPWEGISKPPRGRLSPSLFDFSARHLRQPIDHAIVEIEPAVKRDDEKTRLTLDVGEPFARLHERHFSLEGQPVAYSVVDVDDKFIRFEVFRRQ